MHEMDPFNVNNVTVEAADTPPTLVMNFSHFLNLSEEEYLQLQLGPKHLPLRLVIPITVVYVFIFVMGVFGNVVTCWVILRNPIMQTATNYYLFSLAVSDVMLLVLGEHLFVHTCFLNKFPQGP